MTDSLDLGPEAGVNSTLAALRMLDRPSAPVARGEHLISGVFMDFDPEANFKVEVASPPGVLFSGSITLDGNARWLALHIELGAFDLADRMLLGLACRSTAPESTTFRPCLRNGNPEGFTDFFFRKTAIAYDKPSLHLDALTLAEHPELNQPASWRELVLFLRPEAGKIDLQDLRLFVI